MGNHVGLSFFPYPNGRVWCMTGMAAERGSPTERLDERGISRCQIRCVRRCCDAVV